MIIDYTTPLTQESIEWLKTLPKNELARQLNMCNLAIILGNTNQLNRKILINSLYGAIGNVHFRYYDIRNAEAVTLFGQLVLQWTERILNNFLNEMCGTKNHPYVIYGDTDSLYIELTPLIEKVGLEKFGSTDKLVDFLDAVAEKKIQPVINNGLKDLLEYMNNFENHMEMDREAIACPPLGSKGVGGFFKAKKRYALNVMDMEGVRYKEPYLKIMGIETQSSSTPKAVQEALYESIRRILQEGEQSLQEYYLKFQEEFSALDYKIIAGVKTANNIAKYNVDGFPGLKCPNHIKGVLAYKRAIKPLDNVPDISEGEKVMLVPLKQGNPFNEECIAWQSGSDIPPDLKPQVLKYMDIPKMFNKTYVKPLESICEAAQLKYEKVGDLSDIFDMFGD